MPDVPAAIRDTVRLTGRTRRRGCVAGYRKRSALFPAAGIRRHGQKTDANRVLLQKARITSVLTPNLLFRHPDFPGPGHLDIPEQCGPASCIPFCQESDELPDPCKPVGVLASSGNWLRYMAGTIRSGRSIPVPLQIDPGKTTPYPRNPRFSCPVSPPCPAMAGINSLPPRPVIGP